MKKTFFAVISVALLLLTGCHTTVSVKTLAPSKVDIGSNQVIAVAPTEIDALSGFRRRIPVDADISFPVPLQLKRIESGESREALEFAASYLSQALYQTLSEGVYTIVSPEQTEALLRGGSIKTPQSHILATNGITLLMESSIDYVDADEKILVSSFTSKEGKVFYNYHLRQKYRLKFSYRLYDVFTGEIVDSYTYSGSYPNFSTEETTFIGQLDPEGFFSFNPAFETDGQAAYANIINSFMKQVRDRLVPHAVKLSFNLMDNSSDTDYSEINKLVSEGYLGIALDKYLDIYERTQDVAAGYNCAVLYYGLGKPEEAIALVQDIYKATLNVDAGKLLQKMQQAYEADLKAKEQAGL